MIARALCLVIIAFAAFTLAQESSETYYTEPFHANVPFTNTIQSQWQGIVAPALAIYGWNTTVHEGTYFNVSRADIVTNHGHHFNKTHSKAYWTPHNSRTINGFHLEVADPCYLSLQKDEVFRVHYHAETDARMGTWGQYLRVESVPTLLVAPKGGGTLLMPVCRHVYTPDLVCEMISHRFIHVQLAELSLGQEEEFNAFIEAGEPLNQLLAGLTVVTNGDCASNPFAPSRVVHKLSNVTNNFFMFTYKTASPNLWIMLSPVDKIHTIRRDLDFYTVGVVSMVVAPPGAAPQSSNTPLSGGAIFGIVIAVIAGVGIIGFALYYFREKWMPGKSYVNI